MAFTGCDEVVEDLLTILRGWDVQESTLDASGPAILRLKRTRRGFQRVSSWLHVPSECRAALRSHKTDALFGIHYDLLKWYVEAQQARPCLHCAAVEFGSGLVVFPNTTRAGKTTLAIQLARVGHRIFCDDWLPIEQPGNLGVALGILPWLRLPAPRNVRDDFRAFLKPRRGPGNRRWTYVDLQAGELAPRGATAAICGLVLLDRKTKGKARLEAVAKDRMLTELIEQNYARQLPAMDVFDKLHQLIQTAECFRLRYADVRQAGAVLRSAFDPPARQVRGRTNRTAMLAASGRTG